MGILQADTFRNDPRVAQARKLLREALQEHQLGLSAVRPPDPELAQTAQQTMQAFGKERGGQLFYPYISSGLGAGPFVELIDGSVKLDMITGIGVHVMGHSHPQMLDACVEAALSDTVMQGNLQQGGETAAFSHLLLEAANSKGQRFDHCFLTTSGAMANENALKILFQSRPGADRMLAFSDCFMGRTLALGQITDRPAYRQGMPTVLNVDYIPFFNPERPDESIRRSVHQLRHHLARYPGKHAGMSFELVQGEGGFHAGRKDFFLALIAELKAAGVAVMIDEIQTFGRTQELFAAHHFEVMEHADVLTVGKLSQVCATLFTAKLCPKPGLISQTFTGAASSIHAGMAVIRHLQSGGFYGAEGRIARLHRRFVSNLEAINRRIPGAANGPYGIGGMIAFTPFDGEPGRVKKILAALFDAGLVAFMTGSVPSRIRFLVPVAVTTEAHADLACSMLEKVLSGQLAAV